MNCVAQPGSRLPTSQEQMSLGAASMATQVHALPMPSSSFRLVGMFLSLAPTKDQISSHCTRLAARLTRALSRYSEHAAPSSIRSFVTVFLATPVRRTVERMEHPSTSAETTSARFTESSRFIFLFWTAQA